MQKDDGISQGRFRRLPPDRFEEEETFSDVRIVQDDGNLGKRQRRKVEVDPVEQLPVFDRQLQGPFRGVGLAIMSIACASLIAFGVKLFAAPLSARDALVWGLLGLFCFSVIVVFGLIMLWGLKLIDLPKDFMRYLTAITVAELAAMLLALIRALANQG